MNSLFIEIAGLGIRVESDIPVSDILLDPFCPFLSDSCDRLISRVKIQRSFYDLTLMTTDTVVEYTTNLLGHMSLIKEDGQWIFKLSDGACMVCTEDFRQAYIYLSPAMVEKPRCGLEAKGTVYSLLYILWCQSVVCREAGFFCHASCIEVGGRGYLFLGLSGYGKSTQSELWCKILGANLLNDDCPLLIPTERGAIVSGTPWSGKTPCYRNDSYSVAAILRLARADHNRIEELRYTDAFVSLLPSCSCMRSDIIMQERLYALVSEVVESSSVYKFHCTPTEDAPKVAYRTILSCRCDK